MSNNRVIVTEDRVVIEPEGLNKLWSFTGRLSFPLAHVLRLRSEAGSRTVGGPGPVPRGFDR